MLLDGAVDLALLAHHAFDDVLQKGEIRLAALAVLEGFAHAPGAELRQHLGKIGAGDVHLVERLHGAEPRRGARHLAVRSRTFYPGRPCQLASYGLLEADESKGGLGGARPLVVPLRPPSPRPAPRCRR
jgi:hypothetical protein